MRPDYPLGRGRYCVPENPNPFAHAHAYVSPGADYSAYPPSLQRVQSRIACPAALTSLAT